MGSRLPGGLQCPADGLLCVVGRRLRRRLRSDRSGRPASVLKRTPTARSSALSSYARAQEALWRDDEQLRGALQYCIEPPSETYGSPPTPNSKSAQCAPRGARDAPEAVSVQSLGCTHTTHTWDAPGHKFHVAIVCYILPHYTQAVMEEPFP